MANGSKTQAISELIEQAVEYDDFPDWEDLSQAALQEITTSRGIDFATVVYYDRLRRSTHHAPVIDSIDTHQASRQIPDWNDDQVLALVPGSFYREYPYAGADGALVREVAEKLGLNAVLVATDGQGLPAANGQLVADWITNESSNQIILASICTGAACVLDALQQLRGSEDVSKVVIWLNICGLVQGTPLSNWVHASRWRKWTYQIFMRLQHLNFQLVSEMRWQPTAAAEAWIPPELPLIHVQGVPLSGDMTNRLTTTCRRRIAAWGPNDGIFLLADTMDLPGFIYPVWGTDHYMRPSWRMKKVVAGLLRYIHSTTMAPKMRLAAGR